MNVGVRELCGVMKRVDESFLQWFSHVEKTDNKIAKSLSVTKPIT